MHMTAGKIRRRLTAMGASGFLACCGNGFSIAARLRARGGPM